MSKSFFTLFFFLLGYNVYSQSDTIVHLHEVTVSDIYLKKYSNTQVVTVLNDSTLRKNQGSFTSLLLFNSTVYFKENGAGMVSSPSFRGTTAQQTAVVWNGININSNFNGQTDFNTINPLDFNSITVKAGGGSVIYGTGAIGGSIHLNTNLEFNSKTSHQAKINYGSFNTIGGNYQFSMGKERWTTQIVVSRNSSDNDYEYIGRNKKNENGEYYNQSLNTSFGYKLSESNFLKLYSSLYDSERHFSGTTTVKSRSKYQDINTRNLLEWIHLKKKWTTSLKLAHLTESYKYFENKNTDNYTDGKVATWLFKYNLNFALSSNTSLDVLLDYTNNKGEASSIDFAKRNIGTASILYKQVITSKIGYELGVRKEISDVYESPILFSFGSTFDATSFYKIKLNVSRNYRIPTFNDLYWQGSGNLNLSPEKSLQGEITNEIYSKKSKISVTTYYQIIDDMIRWTPNSSGFWQPENVEKVRGFGIETLLSTQYEIANHKFVWNASYAYTVSENDNNGKQLIYVPFHKLNGSLSYNIGRLTFCYQMLYNGEVFTSTDNQNKLNDYRFSNLGLDYSFFTKHSFKLGFQVVNLENVNYQNVASRPMPGRHFNAYLTLNL